MSINYAGCLSVAFVAGGDGECVQVDRLSGTTIMINLWRIGQHNKTNIHYIHRLDEDKIRSDSVQNNVWTYINALHVLYVLWIFVVWSCCFLICFGSYVVAIACSSWGSRDLHSDHWLALACDVRFGLRTATVCNWWCFHPRFCSLSHFISGWKVQSFEVANGMFQQTQLINAYII